MTINLSKRLFTIASLVNKGEIIADVGSDHGHLPIFLYEQNISKTVYAIENKNGPYQILKHNLEQYGFPNSPILSDGISNLPSDCHVVIIAGMGAHTILKILANQKISQIKSIIIDSHNDLDIVRKGITSLGFIISKEILIYDEGKYYTIMRFERGTANYSDYQYFFGPILLEKKDKIFIEYWNKQIDIINKLLSYPLSNEKEQELLKEKSMIMEVTK